MTVLDELTPSDPGQSTDPAVEVWVDVCRFDDLIPDRGVCALVAGAPVAVFRCAPDDALFAIANVDPYSEASVLSRGIVGSVGDRVVVASPLFKQRFDLATGIAVDDPAVSVTVFPIRCHEGIIQISAPSG